MPGIKYDDETPLDAIKESISVSANIRHAERGSGAWMVQKKIGCRGAYCRTCREFQKTCKGCKLGYLDGSRDLSRAKCKIKRCCLVKGYVTCVDCSDYDSCEIIQAIIRHPGYNTPSMGRRWGSSASMIMLPS